jgi:hypothetical protein
MRTIDHVTFRRSPHVLFRRVGGEILLGTPSREGFGALSTTASAVWELLEEPHTLSSLVQELALTYDVAPESIESDVEALLRDLVQAQWIEEVRSNDT